MHSEGWNNDVFAARSEGDDPNAPVPKIYATGPVKPALAER